MRWGVLTHGDGPMVLSALSAGCTNLPFVHGFLQYLEFTLFVFCVKCLLSFAKAWKLMDICRVCFLCTAAVTHISELL